MKRAYIVLSNSSAKRGLEARRVLLEHADAGGDTCIEVVSKGADTAYFEKAVRRCIKRGFESMFIFSLGKLTRTQECGVYPETVRLIRRERPDIDFHFAGRLRM
ncbi:MAG: hypothetical protein Q8R76_01710 [Candidatus Omnitrophota bacterium]|nr:hypothetical protein [Candidatus Omnitrophota bacterium]